MSNYNIFETDEFLKKIKKISSRDKIFIERKLLQNIYPQLKEEPHYGNNIKKLMDYKPETWRYRIGKYRLFYVINEIDQTVYIISIDLRKDAYN
ncbi:MAG: type II toxin-antitoxin system RelE/ParE family toxin [Ignavibacteriaceae bacterium]|nr:type II toxin-antitoxin system RelE/ParE family toxin [Ignavibacteriaceae bacterium]HRP93423.1 type II toxin-antitoxin system RelE/ParE family toxin [Ignavibacteriaceae bacterium]